MSNTEADAINRMVTSFQMGSNLPDDLDVNSEEIKAYLATLSESRKSAFLAMTSDPDVRKMSTISNRGMGKYWQNVNTAKEQGKKIVFIPFNCSPEIFYAMDLIPVGVEVLNTMASTLEEGLDSYLDLSIERGLPDSMCSAQRGVVGMLEAGMIEKPALLVNGALGGCDPNSKIFEYMSEKFDIPCMYIDVPYYHDQRALDYYTVEYRKMVDGLEEVSGNKLDYDRLREVCELSNQATELIMEINELKRHVPNPVPNFYNVMHLGNKLTMVGTQDAVDFYRTALDICKNRLDQGKHAMPDEKIRFMMMYTGYYFDWSIFSWMEEELGVSYVHDVLVFYDFNPIVDTTSVDSMLSGLAEGMLNLPMTRQLKGGWDMHGNWLWDLLYYIETYKIDCIAFTGHTACKQAWGIYRIVADEIKKQKGVPSLRLEGDGWDSRITPISVIKEQFEEFFATLE